MKRKDKHKGTIFNSTNKIDSGAKYVPEYLYAMKTQTESSEPLFFHPSGYDSFIKVKKEDSFAFDDSESDYDKAAKIHDDAVEQEESTKQQVQEEESAEERNERVKTERATLENFLASARKSSYDPFDMVFGSAYPSAKSFNSVYSEKKSNEEPKPVEDEEVIINISELADKYAMLECEANIKDFTVETYTEEYRNVYDKHFNLISSFKRNNNGE